MKKASIIGFGDIRFGDLCVGSCIIEALEQENLGDTIQLAFLGHDPRDADLWLYDIDFAIILGSVDTGGQRGKVYSWDLQTFQKQYGWFSQAARAIKTLGEAMVRAQVAGGFPDDVLLLWIEPATTEGVGMSGEVRKAFRKVIGVVKTELVKRKMLPETVLKVASIYRLEVPPMVI